MTRGAKTPGKRVKTAKGRTASQVRWLERQLNDPYVRQAKADGYRSRAAYKLIELDEKFGLLKGASRVVDLALRRGAGARSSASSARGPRWWVSTCSRSSRSRG